MESRENTGLPPKDAKATQTVSKLSNDKVKRQKLPTDRTARGRKACSNSTAELKPLTENTPQNA